MSFFSRRFKENFPFTRCLKKSSSFAYRSISALFMPVSYTHLKLRDNYPSFSEFVAAFHADADAITEKLKMIDYEYDETQNKFV